MWNRSPGPAHELTERGAIAVARPEDAAADVVITVLPDLPQVEEVLDRADGLLAGWSRREQSAVPPLLVVMGTVSPTGVRVLAARLRDRNVHVVDAPVSGGVDGAQRGALSIMVGGDADDFGRLQPLLAVLGSTVRHLGPTGSGQLVKACNQIVVAATVAAVSEALALARASGLNAATIVELMSGGLAGSEVLRQKRDKWLNEDFSPGGSAINQLKDLRIAVAAAAAVDVDVPITRRTEALFARMVDEGLGDRDHAGLYLLLADRSRSRRQDAGGDAA